MMAKYKNFIFNGLTYGVVFFILSFILGYCTFKLPLGKVIFSSGIIAMVVLIINGFIQSRFTKPLKILHAIKIPLEAFETSKIESPANHMIDDHLISGKLLLTETRLVFRSFKQQQYSWLLINLHSFQFYPSFFNTGGEFIIEDDNKNKLVFEVDELKLWKRALGN